METEKITEVTQTHKDKYGMYSLTCRYCKPLKEGQALPLRTSNHQALPTEHSNGYKGWLQPLRMQVTNLYPAE